MSMKTKALIMIINLFFGSLCLAAGYITNQNFNEMIENTLNEQQQTASLVMSPTTGVRSLASEYASKIYNIRDKF